MGRTADIPQVSWKTSAHDSFCADRDWNPHMVRGRVVTSQRLFPFNRIYISAVLYICLYVRTTIHLFICQEYYTFVYVSGVLYICLYIRSTKHLFLYQDYYTCVYILRVLYICLYLRSTIHLFIYQEY